ncbi:MAG: polyhydroxyalkanoate synthesis regulator DNA-binding domain-containing protein [Desulfohalobiaceae bacterium]
MNQNILIKKYANRRLYNTRDSSYITLEELSRLIKQGEQVQVQDAKTKADVTAFILTQIILEESKENTILPVSLLHMIIRYGDNLLSEFFEKYLEQMIDVYMSYRSMLDNQFKQWLDLGMDVSGKTQESMLKQFSMPEWMQRFASQSSSAHNKNQDSNE